MWPFKQTCNQTCNVEDVKAKLRDEKIRRLQKWRPIGTEIYYLGRTLIITGHSKFWSVTNFEYPYLSANYADIHGVLRSFSFTEAEAFALMASQP